MPWMETHPVLERQAFIEALKAGERITELCDRFGISRKTGYKWLGRYHEGGIADLDDRPRVPKTLPHRTDEAIEQLVLAAKQERPRWGPKKLVAVLRERHPRLRIPAASTAGEILKRYGLVEPRPHRRRSRIWSSPSLRPVTAPNDTWAIDFKGHFRLGRGGYCYPLTVQDSFSRYLICCEALHGIETAPVKCVLDAAFREYGLPVAIRTDNGSPFAANRGSLGLSELSLWWLKLGIRPERIDRGCPQQNGRLERMHRTLKAEATRPPQRSLSEQQRTFDIFRRQYNQDRPHEALGQRRPATVYQPSLRRMPHNLGSFEYDSAFEARRIAWNGSFFYRGYRYYLTKVLALENVGLKLLDDDHRELWLGPVPVGYIDLQTKRFTPYQGRSRQLESSLIPG